MTDQIFRLDDGLDLVVSHDPAMRRRFASLLLAVTRVGMTLPCSSRKPGDDELCSAIMDSLMDETIVGTGGNVSGGARRRSQFQRVSSDDFCTLCDASKKDVIYAPDDVQLQAVTLKGGNSEHKVTFKMATYINSAVEENKAQTVALSVTNSDLHVSCCMEDGRAVMKLEKCSEDLKTIPRGGINDRFLFYKRTQGLNISSFESVRCRHWFISTAYDHEDEPVEMCQPDAAGRWREFHLH